ncbi:hypothetical protein KY317_03135 [Candidatus Woesearchaeota archaeon]|nr:hypothetical protein [Candidatus Woesearchaeota archaeon]
MKNINKIVWNILDRDLAVQKDLSRRLINMRALAKYIIEKNNLKASLDAIISAIRRYSIKREHKEEEKKLRNIFKDALISTKTNITSITISQNAEEKIPEVVKKIDFAKHETFRLTTGSEEFKIFVDNHKTDDIKSIFTRKEIQQITSNLGEIRIRLNHGAMKTKGVLARIAGEISLRGINIEDVLVCAPEIIIFVKDKDLLEIHESLLQLSKS